jgi:LysM repeat protein
LGELSHSSEYRKRFEKISDRQAIINRGLKNNNFEKIELNTFDKVKNTWAERKKRKAKETVLAGGEGKSIFQGIKESDFGKWYFGIGKAKRLFLGGGIALGVGGAGYAIGRMSSGIAAMGGSALTTLYFEKRISLAENKLHKSLDISGSANLKNEIVDLKKRQLYYSVGIGALSAFAIKGVSGILDSVDEVSKISENIIIESTDTGSESFLVGTFDNNMANSEVLEKTETKKIFDSFDPYNGQDFSVENNVSNSYVNEASDIGKVLSYFDSIKENIDVKIQLEPIATDTYMVQKGDTLSEIAQR